MRGKLVGMFLVGVALSSGAIVQADTMRCGSKLVSESATLDELLQKCGQPQDRQVVKEDQYAINPNGARVKTGLQTVKERWIYQPSSRALPMAVQIVDGKIISITRAD
jgi:hypothetical protein